jgi:hypothetical protein
MDIKRNRVESVDWIYLSQGREQRRVLVDTVMNLRVP